LAEPAVATRPSRAPEAAAAPRPVRRRRPTPAPARVGSAVGRLGQPLPGAVAGRLTRTFGADLSGVRVHAGARSAQTMGARAYALGSDVHLAPGERPTDLPLMAHEVAHILQQGGVVPVAQPFTPGGGDRFETEANQAARAAMRGESFVVREHTPARVQTGQVLDWVAEQANLIPGFRMFTIVLGVNPINLRSVDRSAANILRAVVELLGPIGVVISNVLDRYGVFEKAGAFVEGQLKSLGLTAASIKAAIDAFISGTSWGDILLDASGVWERGKKLLTEPIAKIISFVGGLVSAIAGIVKDAVLKPLASLAEGSRAYPLLKAVLGKDPITGEEVAQTPDALIGGFMTLIGQEEVYENIKKGNAVERAITWFKSTLQGLISRVSQIPQLFVAALKSIEIGDLLDLPGLFGKLKKVFGDFVADFLDWAGKQVMGLLEIIFDVVAPSAMPYIRKAQTAFKKIVKDPIAFIGNLVKAGVQGFTSFASNFLTHLKKSLIEWLTGSLSGANVYIPQAFELKEIVKFVLSVLGLTWQNIRGKLVKATSETVVSALEKTFEIVVTLVRDGPAAAWEKIKESLSNLREMVMDQVMSFVRDKIVQAAITKLLTSLNPAGAFIQAILAIYNAIMFVVEKLKQIAAVAASVIDSLSAIADGAIAGAAKRVEQTLGGMLTLVIAFLARQVGLNKVSDKVIEIINKLRAPIDKALDKVVTWIVEQAKKLGKMVVGGAQAAVSAVLRFTQPKSFSAGSETHKTWVDEQGEPQVASMGMTLGRRLAGWRTRAKSLSDADRPKAERDLGTASGLNADITKAAKDALRARAANNAAAVDAAQTIIDQKQSQLQGVLARLFVMFGDSSGANAEEEARLFALLEVYDKVVVPLKKQMVGGRPRVAGSPTMISNAFKAHWGGSRTPMARGLATQMEQVVAAARNVGTGRVPYLTGVEVPVAGSRIDFTTRDQDPAKKVPFEIATEVKHWGAMRASKDKKGQVKTVEDQIKSRIATLRNQIVGSLNDTQMGYAKVVLEIRGWDRIPVEMQDLLDQEIASYRALAASKTPPKQFVFSAV
jgi:hypothetical protein